MMLFRGKQGPKMKPLESPGGVEPEELMFIGIVYSAVQDEYGSSRLARTWVLKFTTVL